MQRSLLCFLFTCFLGTIYTTDSPVCGRCPRNEFFNECAYPCLAEATCDIPKPTTPDGPCPDYCVQRCECISGYVRNLRINKCVKPEACPRCPPHEYIGCKPCCPDPTCDNLNPGPCTKLCPNICIPECRCSIGFVRDLKSGECVLREKCPV